MREISKFPAANAPGPLGMGACAGMVEIVVAKSRLYVTSKSRIFETTPIEREIGHSARAAELRLRFDKVVRRVTGDLKATLPGVLPEGHGVVITITAPIKHPAKTVSAIEKMMQDGLPKGELRKTIQSNRVSIRPVFLVAPNMPKVLVFVHNPESDSTLLLDIAESRLLERN